jgi:3-oxoacyl-[acyl-carrier protein] reductase
MTGRGAGSMTVIERTELAGLAAVVTGGGHGLGLAMTRALAAAGATVVVADLSDENLADLEANTDGDVVGVHADVAVENDIDRVVATALERCGRIDVVINNAGMNATVLRPDAATNPIMFWDLAPDDFRRFLGVHTVAHLTLARAAVPHMLRQGWGRVVSVTTSHITMLGRGRACYGPPKAASEALVAVMAHDLAGTPVTANVLIPGGPAATHGDGGAHDASTLLLPEVMGPPAVWLASRASDGVTGRRFQACFWEPGRTDAENVARSSSPVAWPAEPVNRRS